MDITQRQVYTIAISSKTFVWPPQSKKKTAEHLLQSASTRKVRFSQWSSKTSGHQETHTLPQKPLRPKLALDDGYLSSFLSNMTKGQKERIVSAMCDAISLGGSLGVLSIGLSISAVLLKHFGL